MSAEAAITIFVSYAHEDETFCQELEKHLQAIKRQQLIHIWHNRNINAGTDWAQQMNEYLNTADIILLLISPDFLASDYCYSVEMQCAMERHRAKTAQVIPIILRPVTWKSTPFDTLTVLPTGGKPVTDWPTQDNAFRDVAESIEKVVLQTTFTRSISIQESLLLPTETQELSPVDGETVLRRVRAGHVPPTWQIFSPSLRDSLRDQLPTYLACASLLSFMTVGGAFLDARHKTFAEFIWIFLICTGVLFLLFCVLIFFDWRKYKTRILVLLPEGYVYGTTDPPQVEYIVNFESALAVQAKGRSVRVTLIAKCGVPLEKAQKIDHGFGGTFPPTVAQTIAGTYLDFERSLLA